MAEQTLELEQLKKIINSKLDNCILTWDGRRKRHGYTNNSFVILGIALSAAITIAGIYDQAALAAVLGAGMAAILALQQVYPFGELSYFYRVGVAEAEILRLKLDTKADTIEEVEALEEKLEILILKMAQEIPRGQAVHDLMQTMREAVPDAAKTALARTREIPS